MQRRILSGGIFFLFCVLPAYKENIFLSQFINLLEIVTVGEADFQTEQYCKPSIFFREAHAIAIKENFLVYFISSLSKMGQEYWNKGKLLESKRCFEYALKIANEIIG
ncbi:MAG: hypothetical protein L0213_05345, partial [Candidatus Dadabacteria bacterium]|nr:hypothetical protein [Candidatus Dadabacteria bacterium]